MKQSEELKIRIKHLKCEIVKLETELVGALEEERKIDEENIKVKLSTPDPRISLRDIQVGHMKGLELELGEPLTKELMEKLYK